MLFRAKEIYLRDPNSVQDDGEGAQPRGRSSVSRAQNSFSDMLPVAGVMVIGWHTICFQAGTSPHGGRWCHQVVGRGGEPREVRFVGASWSLELSVEEQREFCFLLASFLDACGDRVVPREKKIQAPSYCLQSI